MIKLGEKIKSLRNQKNISQEVLANYLGVSFSSCFEMGKWKYNAGRDYDSCYCILLWHFHRRAL